jgi:H+-translocating NAD(P) transhydrogenase subunit alpha
MVPDVVGRLLTAGWEVAVESGAGAGAHHADEQYTAAGAYVMAERRALLGEADVIALVNAQGAVLLSFLQPAEERAALGLLSTRGATYLSFDLLPRISRAQAMDALTSQSTVAGYRAALVAADALDKFFPMLMTAAGTVAPAKVLVMGVGVAGLQAIATARRLGAVVRAYDVRAAAREEAESLGAKFVGPELAAEAAGGYARELSPEELERQREALVAEVAASDAVITTASVPGRTAPVLISAEMVDRMGPGSVIVDIAADSGGNCELSVPGQIVYRGGVAVMGVSNPAAAMPTHASFLYARNVQHCLELLVGEGGAPDWNDEILRGCAVLRHGRPATPEMAEVLGMSRPGAGRRATNRVPDNGPARATDLGAPAPGEREHR